MRTFTKPAILLALSLIAGCTQAPPPGAAFGGNSYPQVPPLIAETIPKPPVTSEALMWQPGHWDWNGSGYVWARGQYIPARGHGNLWVPGWWARSDAGWVWQPAHWTS